MTCLLDTHVLIWSVLATEKLSGNVDRIIRNKENEIYISTISLWEVSLKVRMKKFFFKGLNIKELPVIAEKMGFGIISPDPAEAITYCDLETKDDHKDPFDRMLIWQAIKRDLFLLSRDVFFKQYEKNGLKLVW